MKFAQSFIENFHRPSYEKRSLLKQGLARFRLLTHSNRALPDFMIIGAQKGGTTSLYKYLAKHPDIKANFVVKELGYFDKDYSRGDVWYRSNFPIRKKGRLYYEGTTHYLFNPLVPARVKKTIPNVKVIALLRNPIDRAYSSYKHQTHAGRETLSFEDAINAEAGRLAGEKEKLLSDSTYNSYNYNHFSYIERSKYAEQVENWLQFFSKDQMLILSSEEFFSDTATQLDKVYRFLGVKEIQSSCKKQHNTGQYKDKMSSEIRQSLADIFKEHNKKLYKLVNRRFGWD